MTDEKLKLLEMTQAVITRMNQCSFMIKGWSIVIVAALFALSANDSNPIVAGFAFLPALIFWFLDAYFLRQERLYRQLFDSHVGTPDDEIVFTLSAAPKKGDWNTCFPAVFISHTLLFFHGGILCTIAAALALVICSK